MSYKPLSAVSTTTTLESTSVQGLCKISLDETHLDEALRERKAFLAGLGGAVERAAPPEAPKAHLVKQFPKRPGGGLVHGPRKLGVGRQRRQQGVTRVERRCVLAVEQNVVQYFGDRSTPDIGEHTVLC